MKTLEDGRAEGAGAWKIPACAERVHRSVKNARRSGLGCLHDADSERGRPDDSGPGEGMTSSNSYWQARDRHSENVRASTRRRPFAPRVPRGAPSGPQWKAQMVQRKQREARERRLPGPGAECPSYGRAWCKRGGCGCECLQSIEASKRRSVEALENALLISRHLFELCADVVDRSIRAIYVIADAQSDGIVGDGERHVGRGYERNMDRGKP
ncbi:hypothetical protein B0H19DRAFT_1308617 [Mycena capillaripes]|nr:hypothetical protein B0H19DRAFT_1308617 [Mycena capillaripes]